MTSTRALPTQPPSPETPDGVGPATASEVASFPEVMGALSSRWSRTSSLPNSALPSTKAAGAISTQPWDMVDEWGLQSFPASDPPSNW